MVQVKLMLTQLMQNWNFLSIVLIFDLARPFSLLCSDWIVKLIPIKFGCDFESPLKINVDDFGNLDFSPY